MGEGSLSALRRLAGESFSDGWRVAPNEKNAPVDSPAPANGMTLRDFPTPEACRRSRSEFVVIVRDPEHYLLGCFDIHLLGHDTGFLGSQLPMFWIVEMRGIAHSQTITRGGERSNAILTISHHAYLLPVRVEIRPHVGTALAAGTADEARLVDSRCAVGPLVSCRSRQCPSACRGLYGGTPPRRRSR